MLNRATPFLASLAAIILLSPVAGHVGAAADLAQVDLEKAARIKAAYLYHLARLAIWPESTFAAPSDSLRVCIVGDDPFGLADLFRSARRDLRAGRHPLSVERMDAVGLTDPAAALAGFQLVFFTETASNLARLVLQRGPPRGVLIAAEIDGFCENGGMVGFEIGDERVRIEVNPEALRRSSLRLGAEFMQHATLVASVPDRRD